MMVPPLSSLHRTPSNRKPLLQSKQRRLAVITLRIPGSPMPPLLLLLLLLALVADSYARPLPEAAHAVTAPATKWLLTWSDEFEGSDINFCCKLTKNISSVWKNYNEGVRG